MIAIINLSDDSITIDQRSPGNWRLDLPDGVSQVSPVQIGWEGEGFRIADVQRFTAPEGKVATGAPSYALDGDVVIETYAVADAPPPAPPRTISDRQFFQYLASAGLITEAEAEDAVATGSIPAAMMALIDQLPPEHRHPARMFLKGATTFEIDHPMTQAFAQLYGWSESDLAQVWINAAAL